MNSCAEIWRSEMFWFLETEARTVSMSIQRACICIYIYQLLNKRLYLSLLKKSAECKFCGLKMIEKKI